jgi:hypothetical protein
MDLLEMYPDLAKFPKYIFQATNDMFGRKWEVSYLSPPQ